MCPTCSGPGVELGSLGFRPWYRCRDCGLTFQFQDSALRRDSITCPRCGLEAEQGFMHGDTVVWVCPECGVVDEYDVS